MCDTASLDQPAGRESWPEARLYYQPSPHAFWLDWHGAGDAEQPSGPSSANTSGCSSRATVDPRRCEPCRKYMRFLKFQRQKQAAAQMQRKSAQVSPGAPSQRSVYRRGPAAERSFQRCSSKRSSPEKMGRDHRIPGLATKIKIVSLIFSFDRAERGNRSAWREPPARPIMISLQFCRAIRAGWKSLAGRRKTAAPQHDRRQALLDKSYQSWDPADRKRLGAEHVARARNRF